MQAHTGTLPIKIVRNYEHGFAAAAQFRQPAGRRGVAVQARAYQSLAGCDRPEHATVCGRMLFQRGVLTQPLSLEHHYHHAHPDGKRTVTFELINQLTSIMHPEFSAMPRTRQVVRRSIRSPVISIAERCEVSRSARIGITAKGFTTPVLTRTEDPNRWHARAL